MGTVMALLLSKSIEMLRRVAIQCRYFITRTRSRVGEIIVGVTLFATNDLFRQQLQFRWLGVSWPLLLSGRFGSLFPSIDHSYVKVCK